MGLTSRDDNAGQGKATFLGVAGGYIWDKSAGKDHPSYKTQEYAKLEGEVGVRAGARYIKGIIKNGLLETNFNETL